MPQPAAKEGPRINEEIRVREVQLIDKDGSNKGVTEISAYVIEQAGTAVQNGTSVRFTTSLGRVDPVEVETHNGMATTTFFAGDVSGVAEVRATSGNAGAGTTTSVVPGRPRPAPAVGTLR